MSRTSPAVAILVALIAAPLVPLAAQGTSAPSAATATAAATASAKVTAYWGTDYLLLGNFGGKWMVISVLWQSPPKQ